MADQVVHGAACFRAELEKITFGIANQQAAALKEVRDRYLCPENQDRLRVVCTTARFATTENLGHSRILASPIMLDLVAAFLGQA